jgi:hypothetical protein
MTVAYQQALGLLPKMTQDERKNLRVALGQLRGTVASSGASEKISNDDWLFDGVIKELARRGLVYRLRDAAGIRRMAPNYEEESMLVREALEKSLRHGMPDFRPAHLTALGKSSARCLATYITSWKSKPTLGLRFMLINAGLTLEAIDCAFPGYISSGMVSVLVQRSSIGD